MPFTNDPVSPKVFWIFLASKSCPSNNFNCDSYDSVNSAESFADSSLEIISFLTKISKFFCIESCLNKRSLLSFSISLVLAVPERILI
jgi:hypothetical protein